MNKKRAGFIKISHDIFIEQSNLVKEIYKYFYPVQINCSERCGIFFVLHGYCDAFEEIKEGETWPQYDVTFTEKEDKTFDLKFTAYK